MPYISKQIVKELIETLDVCGVGVHHIDLLALLDQPEGEPSDYYLIDVDTGRKYYYDKDEIKSDVRNLMSPLYTHPPAPRKQITAEDVTDEMVDAVEDVVIARPDEWDVVDPKEIIAASVTIYLGIKK